MSTIAKLKAWLKKPGNSKALLAGKLGYDTSNAVEKWVVRGRIPRHQEARVLEIIEGKEVTDGSQSKAQ